jgi:hypothetical protein
MVHANRLLIQANKNAIRVAVFIENIPVEKFAINRTTAITTSLAPPFMPLRATRQCATRHKLDIQR